MIYLKKSILNFFGDSNNSSKRKSIFDDNHEESNFEESLNEELENEVRSSFRKTRTLAFYSQKFKDFHMDRNPVSKERFLNSHKPGELKKKYLLIKSIIMTFFMINFLLNLVGFEIQSDTNKARILGFVIHSSIAFLGVVILILWIGSLFVWTLLKKLKFEIPDDVNFVSEFGVTRFIVTIFFFGLFPGPNLLDIWVSNLREIFFKTNLQFAYFNRYLIDYVTICNLVFISIFVFSIVIENLYFSRGYNCRLSKNTETDVGFQDMMKMVINQHPFCFGLLFVGYEVFLFFFILRIAEIPKVVFTSEDLTRSQGFVGYFDCLWFVVTTFSTVGFQSVGVQTMFGRVVVYFIGFFGMFSLISIIILILRFFEMTKLEKLSYLIHKKVELNRDTKKVAAKLIANQWRMFNANHGRNRSKRDKIQTEVDRNSMLLKELRREYKNVRLESNPVGLLRKETEKISRDCQALVNHLKVEIKFLEKNTDHQIKNNHSNSFY